LGEKRHIGFSNNGTRRGFFENRENVLSSHGGFGGSPIVFTQVLSPEGRWLAYPVGVQLRLFPFIEFWVRKGILDFETFLLERPFFCFKMFYFTGGRVGRSPKVSFNIFHFKIY